MTRFAAPAGFATTEASAIVMSLSMLAATVASPHLLQYLELARLTKAEGDVRVLAVSLVRLLNDIGSLRSTSPYGISRPNLLASDGAPPAVLAPQSAGWSAAPDGHEVQSLTAHLVDNAAGYPEGDRSAGHWRGPYVERLGSDPWGNRYASNVVMLRRDGPGVTVVLSAGANHVIETPFETIRLHPGGDDIVSLVWATH